MAQYYVSKNGNDSNDGLSWATAKLTVDAAKGDNRRIIVGPGTYAETLDWSGYSGVELVSAVKWGAKLTSSGEYTILLGESMSIGDFWVDNTNTVNGNGALKAVSKDDILLHGCKCIAASDAVINDGCRSFKISKCNILGSEYGYFGSTSAACIAIIEDSFIDTDNLWQACSVSGIAVGAGNLIIKDCQVRARKSSDTITHSSGIYALATARVLAINSFLSGLDTSPAGVFANGVLAQYGGHVVLRNCIAVSGSTNGTAYDLNGDAGGTISVDQTSYSTAAGAVADQQKAILDLVTP